MKTILLFLFSVVMLLFTGCQSSRQMSSPPSVATGVQPANIYLMRPHRFAGDGVAPDLYLDGQLISRLASGDYTIFRVSPGSHMIGAKLGDSGFSSQRVECEVGKEYFFRVVVGVTPIATVAFNPLPAAGVERLKAHLNFMPLN